MSEFMNCMVDSCLGCDKESIERELLKVGIDPSKIKEVFGDKYEWHEVITCKKCGKKWLPAGGI
jgi:predicted nucleic-acid-binding Zn-ribbon protein